MKPSQGAISAKMATDLTRDAGTKRISHPNSAQHTSAAAHERVIPARAFEHQAHQRGHAIEADLEIKNDPRQVAELRGCVGGAIDRLVRQHQGFDRVDQAVARLGHQHAQQHEAGVGEASVEVRIEWAPHEQREKAAHRRHTEVEQGDVLESRFVAAELVEHVAALAELAEQVHQEPVAPRIDSECAEQARDRGAAQELPQGAHSRRAARMRPTPGSVSDELVSVRKTSSSVAWCVEAFRLSAVASAMIAP
jgi:hypothetical protein